MADREITVEELEELLASIEEDKYKGTFPEIIYEARISTGLHPWRIGASYGSTPYRIWNLESGKFRKVPSKFELKALADILNLDFHRLENKAYDWIEYLYQREQEAKRRNISVDELNDWPLA